MRGNDLALGVGGLGDAAEQVNLERGGACPIGHLHQVTDGIILITDFLAPHDS